MAFCEHCGKQLADGEVCTCMAGQQTAAPGGQGTAPAGDAQPVSGEAVPTNGDKKKLYLIAGGVAVVVILLFIIIRALIAKPYMEPVEDFMKLMNKRSTSYEEIAKAKLPGFAQKKFAAAFSAAKKADEFADSVEAAEENMAEYYEDAEDEFEKWKVSFELKKAEKMDEDDLDDLKDYIEDYFDDYIDSTVDTMEDALEDEDDLEDLADALDMKEKEAKKFCKKYVAFLKAYKDLKVTDGYEVKGKFIIKSKDGDCKTETLTFRVLKVNGDWCYYGIANGTTYGFKNDDEGVFNFLYSTLNRTWIFNTNFF